MKVFLSGAVGGSYRSQNIIKVLGDNGILFSYLPTGFIIPNFKWRFLKRLVGILLLFFTIPFRFFLISLASHVLVLPMNFHIFSALDIFFARLLRKRIIVDFYISNYDTLVNDRQLLKQGSLSAKWAMFKDRFFMSSASTLIFLNQSEALYYSEIAGITNNIAKIKIIPLCVDYRTEFFIEGHKDQVAKDFFSVCWWGTYIPLHGLENLINAFTKISNKKIKLYLFGDSEKKSKPYKELIESYGLSEHVIVNNDFSFSNGKLAPFLKENCDLAVGNFGSSAKAKTVLVNKLVDALSLGLPCLTMSTKAVGEFFAKNEGVILTDVDPDSIARSILYCFENQDELGVIGKMGKLKYLSTFSPDAFKIRLLSVFEN
ncbi:glycosyltransferase [Pseudohongiella spirulinae]|uniref:Glycosyl transferase family 1 domain-containing protein n=1 Tax=Pseudohongiella spirulinae TaxID=1249552 RepID=A0A0S2KDN2_9GAMM|nr:glycosyltransferase [Pseudohongiella spirulinae]ALO46413.1 hypothetical protein PS2015_1763 [Pseudohongiella spirulinae]